MIPDPQDHNKIYVTTFGGSVWHGSVNGKPEPVDIATPVLRTGTIVRREFRSIAANGCMGVGSGRRSGLAAGLCRTPNPAEVGKSQIEEKKPSPATALSEYEPKSMLQVHETQVERAKYPVIDFHTHISVSTKSKKGVELSPERQYLGTPKNVWR